MKDLIVQELEGFLALCEEDGHYCFYNQSLIDAVSSGSVSNEDIISVLYNVREVKSKLNLSVNGLTQLIESL